MKRQSFYRNTSSGFTLIELLVVIAIIGILASVILSSLETGRSQARDATAVSQLKQIQTALELVYLNQGSYPAGGAGDWRSISDDPACTTSGANVFGLLNLNPHMSQMPGRLQSGQCLWYQVRNGGQGYYVAFIPENTGLLVNNDNCEDPVMSPYWCIGNY